jgi:hypothetical protein
MMENVIREIDAQIARLQQARAALTGTSSPASAPARRGPGRPKASVSLSAAGGDAAPKNGRRKRRGMSPEGRARIAAAQKARWAKIKGNK